MAFPFTDLFSVCEISPTELMMTAKVRRISRMGQLSCWLNECLFIVDSSAQPRDEFLPPQAGLQC
jgi:hypothetical protein